jgi:hypothetical protein
MEEEEGSAIFAERKCLCFRKKERNKLKSFSLRNTEE